MDSGLLMNCDVHRYDHNNLELTDFGENHSFTIASSEKEKAKKRTTTNQVCVGWVGPPTPKNNLAFTVGFCTDN